MLHMDIYIYTYMAFLMTWSNAENISTTSWSPWAPHGLAYLASDLWPTWGPTIPAFPCPPQPAHVHPAWSDTVGSFSPHTLGQSSTAAVSGGHCGWTTRPWLQQKVHVEWVMSPTRNNLVILYFYICYLQGSRSLEYQDYIAGNNPNEFAEHFLGATCFTTWVVRDLRGAPVRSSQQIRQSSVEAPDPINLAKL
jgi:hypothetical protein